MLPDNRKNQVAEDRQQVRRRLLEMIRRNEMLRRAQSNEPPKPDSKSRSSETRDGVKE